jgi:hypothetical protein
VKPDLTIFIKVPDVAEGGGRDERCGAGVSGGQGQGLERERAGGGDDEKGGKAAEVTQGTRQG